MNNLSAQAKWYLFGRWPIIRMNDVNPEPTAMRELTAKGYAVFIPGKFPMHPEWRLSETGKEEKAHLERIYKS